MLTFLWNWQLSPLLWAFLQTSLCWVPAPWTGVRFRSPEGLPSVWERWARQRGLTARAWKDGSTVDVGSTVAWPSLAEQARLPG